MKHPLPSPQPEANALWTLLGKPRQWTTPMWLLVTLVVVAFLLRLGLVQHGLPLLLYEDEPIYYNHALNFGLGTWNIHYFKKPSFFLYFYGAFYWLGFLYSRFMSWKDYVDAFWQNPTYVATIGRTVSVCFAAASVYLTGRLGWKAFSAWVGIAAALLLAVDYTHLRISPIVISDIPSLFCILLSGWFALRISETGQWRDYLLCALSVALTISFKYNLFSAAFLVAGHLAYALNHARQTGTSPNWKATFTSARFWLALAAIPLGVLVLNPRLLIDFPAFWSDFNYERQHMLKKSLESDAPTWRVMAAFDDIFFKILPRSLGWVAYIAGLIGMVWAGIRYRTKALVLLSFPLVFLLVVSQFRLINAKYLLPVYPFWYLMAALFFQDALRWMHERLPALFSKKTLLPLFILLTVGAASWNGFWVANHLAVYTRPDTRQVAYVALPSLLQDGDRLLMEPDTLTLNNRIIRSSLISAIFQKDRFQVRPLALSSLNGQLLKSLQPQWVMLELGQADKEKNARGETVYRFPYPADYYEILQARYRVRALYLPYTVQPSQRSPELLNRVFQTEGLSAMYALIQQHKSARKQPGPSLLLLEKKPGL